MRRLTALLAVVGLIAPASASGASIVRVTMGQPAHDLPVLARLGFDVTENVRPGYADVVLYSRRDARRLRAAGFAFRAVPHPRAARAAAAGALPSGRTTYRHYADYVRELGELVASHPGLARAVTLPQRTVLGQPILGVELASGVNRDDDGRPVYLVLGEHHAREWPSGEVAMEFALDLAHRYGADPRITSLLDRERVLVVPVVNPDGFQISREDVTADSIYAETSHSGALRRKNCAADTPLESGRPCRNRAGVDLNRNYGAAWGGVGSSTQFADDDYRGPAPWSEPETRAVHELSQGLQITGLETLHNYAGLVLRPPGSHALGPAPDEARLRLLGDAMGRVTGYTSEYGYELYDVTGATEDWNYAAQGAFGYTIELGGPGFQGPYQQSVVDQYLGRPGTASAGLGTREALLLAGEEAADPADHAIVRGTAPAGSLLRLHKDFRTATSPVCPVASALSCPVAAVPLQLDDHLDTTLVVPPDGHFVWHVGPSTRPFEHRIGHSEAWTLTCAPPGGEVAERRDVVVWRGQTASVDLGCGTGAPSGGPVVAATPADPASAQLEGRLRSLTSPAPPGASLRLATRRTGHRLRVAVRATGTTVRDLSVLLRARGEVVAAGRLARPGTIVLRLPRGLVPGRYRLAVTGYAPNGAALSARAAVTVRG